MARVEQPTPNETDVVFIGAGHNAIVCAAYLARAGLRVLLLESQPKVGGGVTTEEAPLPPLQAQPPCLLRAPHAVISHLTRPAPQRVWA